jgi:soluble cytochrome b562
MLVHKLAGSAGSYGCPNVGKAARDYEILISTYLNSGTGLEPADYKQFKKGFDELAAAVDQAVKSAS